MISLVRYIYNWFNSERSPTDVEDVLEREVRRFEVEVKREYAKKSVLETNMKNLELSQQPMRNTLKDDIRQYKCFERKGIITELRSNNGTIDNHIFFDLKVAGRLTPELSKGCQVKYLAYKTERNEHTVVVQIKEVTGTCSWDESVSADSNLDNKISELQKVTPTYFPVHQRNILGLITERKPDAIIVDTEQKLMTVYLDSVEIDFVPYVGDCVVVCCDVQSDDLFVDFQGEILQEVSVHPTRRIREEKRTVTELFTGWGALSENCYFTFDILSTKIPLNVGDIVSCDLIECKREPYIWRCTSLTLLDSIKVTDIKSADVNDDIKEIDEDKSRKPKESVTVSENPVCVLSELKKTAIVEVTMTSNIDRSVHVQKIQIFGRKRDSQVRLIEPTEELTEFELEAGASRTLKFQVEAKKYGESIEVFAIKFDKFRIKRKITIIVCEDAEVAKAIRTENFGKSLLGGRYDGMSSRIYANQVWSKKNEVVPGVGPYTKRRFIANRIGQYEVPERLRRAYLSSESRLELENSVESMFPELKAELTIKNYIKRFSILIYLEEIEYYVNFRKYDCDRAHFSRDGDYLSLTIENLSERRPSLVIGDSVRIVNPWSETENRCYEGVIHKVLFNRILLKFNGGFQSSYSGEDYRLEFQFSRFGFRKQHYAINRITAQLGEPFLFPSKICLRERLQLNAELDSEDNLDVGFKKCEWFNSNLNSVQKRAVRNVLRGEVHTMPYVIFGPPGTGKTLTLIETILQLLKNLPSARLLVATPSNSSADLIALRIIESKQLHPGDFVRLVSQNQVEKELIPENLMPYCATVDMGMDNTCDDSMVVTDSGMKLRCQMKFLGRHRLTIGTCSTIGNFLQMGFPPGHFTHVIIDEAGQCTEPDLMMPICLVSQARGQVILAGDPQQLPAIVINRYAADRGFATSFLERILECSPYLKDRIRFRHTSGFDPRLVTKLLYNYRSLPSILKVYNVLFYESELLPMISETNSPEVKLIRELDSLLPQSKVRPKSHGVFFFGMRSENRQEPDSPSWYNPIEARTVFLMCIKLYRKDIEPDRVGIIAPYAKQAKHLRSLFMESDVAMPKIGSVEEFQGQERDIIIVSTVRSCPQLISADLRQSMGFIQSVKRMNVAISRPRSLLLVYGNPELLCLDKTWRAFIKYCVDNEAYSGCVLPRSFDLHRNEALLGESNEEFDNNEA